MTDRADLHVRADQALIDAARRRARLPEGTTLPGLARFALARLAGWPDVKARQAARGRRGHPDQAEIEES